MRDERGSVERRRRRIGEVLATGGAFAATSFGLLSAPLVVSIAAAAWAPVPQWLVLAAVAVSFSFVLAMGVWLRAAAVWILNGTAPDIRATFKMAGWGLIVAPLGLLGLLLLVTVSVGVPVLATKIVAYAGLLVIPALGVGVGFAGLVLAVVWRRVQAVAAEKEARSAGGEVGDDSEHDAGPVP